MKNQGTWRGKSQPASIQIQSVLYKNEPEALVQALDNIANAVRVDRAWDHAVSDVTVSKPDLYTAGNRSAPEKVQRLFHPHLYIFQPEQRYGGRP